MVHRDRNGFLLHFSIALYVAAQQKSLVYIYGIDKLCGVVLVDNRNVKPVLSSPVYIQQQLLLQQPF